MNILLRSAKIIDKNSKYHNKKMDILIKNGMISEIGKTLEGPKNCREINLKNLHVSMGWFDSSVSLGEPGFEERENIEHGLEVAAKSGFTRVAVNPNTNPLIDNKSAVEFLIQKAKDSAVDLHPIANLTQGALGREMAELYDMKNSGAIAFGDYNKSIENANLLKIALLYVQNFDGIVMSFPQDEGIGKHGFVNESENTTRLGLNSIPNLSEELQITRDLSLLEYTGGKLHIPTISTHKGVQLVKEAKKKGLDVTCSVTAHHLYLTDEELSSFDTNYKVNPPLRATKDTKALIKGIKEGVVDMIVSDHNPIDIENKNVEFENAHFGTIGMESLFGSVGSIIDLEDAIVCLTENPRKRFDLPVGIIEEDNKAELTLFDPEIDYIFEEKNILSKSKNSAFLGKQLKGRAYGIIANKQLILS
ncbi:dihydroorotase [Lutimonas saemankumensis]|uniref:dihydroorotase n=1 Tax=Lutimonas saemankumensis TaxID=483016 RepID=UPI001CD79A25|nr:dihydroorotase [Lutimonas saemankumensis]MCA0932127.1 dihydroorotase [Lutimonas saemankumensis]